MSKWKHKRSVMRRYNLTAQMYDARYCEEQEAKYKAALEGLRVSRESIVLDVGCGSGLFFSHVAGKANVVVGVDVSRELLLLANIRAKEFPDVYLVKADADHLPFRQEIFTHIFAFTVLQNMPNPVETLREMRLVGRREACFVVTGLKRVISLEALGDLLQNAGLQIVSVRDDVLHCYVVVSVQGQK